jgi:hypothetical protein
MITPLQLVQVGEAILLDPSAASLRRRFPNLHFTECSEADVSPLHKPALSVAGYELYLISGISGHCLALTNAPESATGILVAATVDDD